MTLLLCNDSDQITGKTLVDGLQFEEVLCASRRGRDGQREHEVARQITTLGRKRTDRKQSWL